MRMPDDEDAPLRSKTSVLGVGSAEGYAALTALEERVRTTKPRPLDPENASAAPALVAFATGKADVELRTRAMIAVGSRGAVVNVASMAGVSGAPNMPAYAASKAAVIGLTKAAAKDLAPHGIRVNAVSPAFVGPGRMWETQVARQAAAGSQYYATDPDEVAAQMIGMVPMRRYGS